MEKNQKTALVLGAGGFIGSHMVKRLKSENYWVRGVDLKYPEFSETVADDFIIGDLNDVNIVKTSLNSQNDFFDEIYQFAADMGGAGFIFTGENDANIMHNSCMINLNILKQLNEINQKLRVNNTKIFYSSSACIYPEYNQLDPNNPDCREDSAYPAAPDSEYGWEKLFSEHLYLTYHRNFQIPVRVARYRPEGTWEGGREKAPAAICRKVAQLEENATEIEVWGDGKQTRSFLFIDDCIEATRRLMKSDFIGPINIGSEEMVTINELVDTAAKVASKKVTKQHKLDAPLGVRGRNSNNDLIKEKLKWDFEISLEKGINETYKWILGELRKKHNII